MPPPPPPNHYSEHGGRIAQMTKQEAIIANKRQELLEKKKNAELARQVAAAQLGTPIDSTTTKTSNPSLELFEESTLTRKPPKNNFSNDGSFFENFKRITEAAAKRALKEKELKEQEETAAKRARGEIQENVPAEENEEEDGSEPEESDGGDDDEERPRKRPQQVGPTHAALVPPPPQPLMMSTPPPPRPPMSLMGNPAMPPMPPFGPGGLPFNALPPPGPPAPYNGPAPPPSHFNQNQMPAPFMQGPPPFHAGVAPPPPPPHTAPPAFQTSSGPSSQSKFPINSSQNGPPRQFAKHPPPSRDFSFNAMPDQSTNDGQRIPDRENSEGNNFNQNNRGHFIDDNKFDTIRQTFDKNNETINRNFNAFDGHGRRNADHQPRLHVNVLSNLTTVEALIDYVAANGDISEDKVQSEHNDLRRSPFWFLSEKHSIQYRNYRQAVDQKRAQQNSSGSGATVPDSDKYDPAAILNDEDEEEIGPENEVIQNKPLRLPDVSGDYSDDNDSDAEYHQETRKRNYENIKCKLRTDEAQKLSSYLSSQYDTSDEEEHMELYNKIKLQEGDNDKSNSPPLHQGLVATRPNFQISSSSKDSDELELKSQQAATSQSVDFDASRKRKRSRWGEKVEAKTTPPALMSLNIPPIPGATKVPASFGNQNKPILSSLTRTDPALLNYAHLNYGSTDLTEEDWKKCEDHYKINLLYQDMLKKRNDIDRLAKSGKFKYEYDSDEDVAGGTWEHKLRNAEMEATAVWADALNKQSQGKHHIGDFLPPEELKKFMEQYDSTKMNREPDLSDYKEYKLREDNKGFQMLQKLGWKEGQGLGFDGGGIVNPINKAQQRDSNQGLGATSSAVPESGDNEYDAYRKRMMLAYRFRPNPLNNPRRAYY